MLKSKKLQRLLVVGLVLALGIAAPVQAQLLQKIIKWLKKHKAEITTVAGVAMSVANPALSPVGATLVALQGTMAKTSAGIASDPKLSQQFQGPRFCEDGGVSCTAAQGILKMGIPLLEIPEGTDAKVAAFIKAVNRVVEEGEMFAKHCEENASLEVRHQDLAVIARSVEVAADAYDHLDLSFELTQADIDAFQRETRDSGLPRLEEAFWQNAGLSHDEIDAVAKFLGTTELKMPIPSISVSDLLHNAAQGFVPSSK